MFIFESCELWPDIVPEKTWHFSADAPPWNPPDDSGARKDRRIFLERTYPTVRLKELIRIVFGHMSGSSGKGGCLVCLHSPPGGGKTHALCTLASLAKETQIDDFREFVPENTLPMEPVRVSVIDGESFDPSGAMQLDAGLQAYTPWGQLAHQLRGRSGIARMEQWDRERVAPPCELLRELIDADPVLIVLDRMARLWRRFAQTASNGRSEVSAFISGLSEAVAPSPRAALVCTLATRNDPRHDPYFCEHARLIDLLHGGAVHCFPDGVAPRYKPEMAAAMRRFLFKRALSEPETYPMDEEAFDQLVSIVRAANHTHVFGGTLAVLGRSCYNLWRDRPGNLDCIHAEQLDLSPLAERIAYDHWESNGRPSGSALRDIEYAKRYLQTITTLADGIMIR